MIALLTRVMESLDWTLTDLGRTKGSLSFIRSHNGSRTDLKRIRGISGKQQVCFAESKSDPIIIYSVGSSEKHRGASQKGPIQVVGV